MDSHTFLPKGNGYRKLRVVAMAEAVCDLTVIFVRRFVPAQSRTRDQMEQAARPGKQNIAEGSAASASSKETEIKLTNVAKASLEELLLDYEDYLRQHNLAQWPKNHPRVVKMRQYLTGDKFQSNPTEFAAQYTPEEFCNLCITLIHQTTYMLRKLLEHQQKQFLEQGGIKELMYKARVEYRNRQTGQTGQTGQTSQTSPTSPTCPTPTPTPKKP